MKKSIVLGFMISSSLLMAGSCTEWYKNVRQKYHIVGTKTGIVMDNNGEWQKIFAKGTASVDFADEDEYEDALQEAEMKAKANITHFLKEKLSSEKTLDNISKKLKELESNGTSQSTKVSKKTLKVKTQKIVNNASSLLKGIIILCESVDEKKKRAEVVVAVSPKTQRAADSARKSMYKDTSSKKSQSMRGKTEAVKMQGYMDASDDMDF